jgi:hypothetical protein
LICMQGGEGIVIPRERYSDTNYILHRRRQQQQQQQQESL